MREIKIDNSLHYDKVFTYYKTNIWVVVAFSITGLLFDGLMSFIPSNLGRLINMSVQGSPYQDIINQGVFFICLVLFIQFNRFFKRYFVRIFSNRITYVMRKVSFNYIIHSPLDELSCHSKGDILNRNLTDITDASEGIRKITTEFFDTFVLLLGYLVSLFLMDWMMTLISLAFIIASIVFAQLISKYVYVSVKKYKQYLSLTKDSTLCYLKNETYYRGLGVTDFYQKKYEKEQNKLENLADKSLLFKSSLQPIYQCIVWINLAFIIYLGGKRLIQDPTFLIGTFSSYLTTYMLIATKASRVGKLVNAYQDLKVSWERCKIYLKPSRKEDKITEISEKDLEVSHLSFGFDNAKTLNDISFTAHKGEIIGLCGKVHTGKSTLLEAINGLYDYQGSIKLNGIETKELRKEDRPNLISLCSKSEIFSASLEDNITLGRKGDVKEALYISNLENDVNKKADKENEALYRSVSNLSGGQQKRLMIARAVFNKPDLILLDNPFESIDEEMSIEILKRLKEKCSDSIIILVSNQINILSKCDRLLLLDNGITSGTYDSLIKRDYFVSFLGGQAK